MAELNDTALNQHIITKLPIESSVARSGDQIIIKTEVHMPPYNLTTDVNTGDIAFSPEDSCICVFFGRTPLSTSDKPVPEKPVLIIGKTLASCDELREIKEGEKIFISKEAKPADTKSDYPYGERKLSQKEIDELVKKLLAEKAKGQG